jgi:2-phospho-L-lactate guanylyltransferase
MLDHVLRVAHGSRVGDVVVVGGDDTIRALCGHLGLPWGPEPAAGLNACVQQAFQAACDAGWDGVLYLPADLPELNVSDLVSLLEMSESVRHPVIAPDRFGQGTNALLVPTGITFTAMLGTGSFRRHLSQYRDLGIPVGVCRSQGLELDIDTPPDLDVLLARRPGLWAEVDTVARSLALAAAENSVGRR